MSYTDEKLCEKCEMIESCCVCPRPVTYKRTAAALTAQTTAPLITGETSDGHHTFNELYAFRRAYNAVLFNEWAKAGKYNCVKSWKHSDGEPCFGGGWFIVQATLPSGQISNHYQTEYWDDFQIPAVEIAGEYDGHNAVDVLLRLESLFEHPAKSPQVEGEWKVVASDWRSYRNKIAIPFIEIRNSVQVNECLALGDNAENVATQICEKMNRKPNERLLLELEKRVEQITALKQQATFDADAYEKFKALRAKVEWAESVESELAALIGGAGTAQNGSANT